MILKIKFGKSEFKINDEITVKLRAIKFNKNALEGFVTAMLYKGETFHSRYDFQIIRKKDGGFFVTEKTHGRQDKDGNWTSESDFKAPIDLKNAITENLTI